MIIMKNFDEIRPYNDIEVRSTIEKLLKNKRFLEQISMTKFPKTSALAPWLLRQVIKQALKRETSHIDSVEDFQWYIRKYMLNIIESSIRNLTFSGLDKLNPESNYLFISNHRDITMDPALATFALVENGFSSPRIAIGDNLLTQDYISDIMRLNKSFIVNRSAKSTRAKFKAAKQLSMYINHSIINEKCNVWIAQREGRAKDGIDKTNPALINMITKLRPKNNGLTDYTEELKVVPISISYEKDPCDIEKTEELFTTQNNGSYEKSDHEDIESIYAGIFGEKGDVHISFCPPIEGNNHSSIESIVQEIDHQIAANYTLHETNCIAWSMLHKTTPDVEFSSKNIPFKTNRQQSKKEEFLQRMSSVPEEQRTIFLSMYSNPVDAKIQNVTNVQTEKRSQTC